MDTTSLSERWLLLAAASVGLVALGWAGCSTASKATSAAASAAGADVPEVERQTLQPSTIDEAWSFLEESEEGETGEENAESKASVEEDTTEEGSESGMAEGEEQAKEGEEGDEEPENPLATPEHRIEYATIGMEKYDSFFLRSAKLFGKTVLADVHSKRLKKTVESGIVKKMISGELLVDMLNVGSEELSFEDRKLIVQYAFQGKFDQIAKDVSAVSKESVETFKKDLYEEYPNVEKVAKWQGPVTETFEPKKLKTESTKLVKECEKLAKEAPDDFTDEKAAVVPDLTEELKNTGEELKASSERIPKITERMGKTADELGKRIKKAGETEMSSK